LFTLNKTVSLVGDAETATKNVSLASSCSAFVRY